MTKKIVIEFVFDEYPDENLDSVDLALAEINTVETDLTETDLSGLGDSIAQTDFWQVDVWNHIQRVLSGGTNVKVEKY